MKKYNLVASSIVRGEESEDFKRKIREYQKILKKIILKMNRKLRKKLGIFRTNLVRNVELVR